MYFVVLHDGLWGCKTDKIAFVLCIKAILSKFGEVILPV